MNNNELIVQKEEGLFVLRGTCEGEELEPVRREDAQGIIDYVRETWPIGTVIKWRIRPRVVPNSLSEYFKFSNAMVLA